MRSRRVEITRAASAMVRGKDRGQAALLPAAIEDYLAADAPVRVIDAFVNGSPRPALSS